jgi:CRISPR system Cascade subunit CasC
MTTFIQLHLLTAYPPANLNRDDTGKPKTARFGDAERLRISSQSLKRAWRTSEVFASRLADHMGARTQRLGEEIERHLQGQGVAEARARAVARAVADHFGKLKPEKDANPARIEQLAFISPDERDAAFDLADRAAADEATDIAGTDLLRRADGAVDIAMFGRMLADDPEFNRDAAVQVAHAITTHRTVVEDDYYTAVDDLKLPSEDAGAGFVGEAGFGAGLFYLYVCIDRDLLRRNLGGADGLARDGVAALIQAAATVAPKGKQASFASRARASYILAERGEATPRSLAAAFLKPVRGDDILAQSIQAIERQRENFAAAYGDEVPHVVMDVAQARGSLAEIVAFAQG